jgi:hypothetical protein
MKADWTDLVPQCDDSESPDDYDDFDAAIDALRSGLWLIKLPDKLRSKYYRFYVVVAMGDYVPPAAKRLNLT